jgi:hypothetical protein
MMKMMVLVKSGVGNGSCNLWVRSDREISPRMLLDKKFTISGQSKVTFTAQGDVACMFVGKRGYKIRSFSIDRAV